MQWDTFRTLYPLMSLYDPVRFADIVRGMIDIQVNEGTVFLFLSRHFPQETLTCCHKIGWLPECRGATLQQWIQGGSSMLILLPLPVNIFSYSLDRRWSHLGWIFREVGGAHTILEVKHPNDVLGSKANLRPWGSLEMRSTTLCSRMLKMRLPIGIFKADKLMLGYGSVCNVHYFSNHRIPEDRCLDYVPSDSVDTAGHSGMETRQVSRTLEVRDTLCLCYVERGWTCRYIFSMPSTILPSLRLPSYLERQMMLKRWIFFFTIVSFDHKSFPTSMLNVHKILSTCGMPVSLSRAPILLEWLRYDFESFALQRLPAI